MPVSARITSTGKDISVLLDEALSPKAQSAALAGFAREKLHEAEEQNRRALGRVPDHETVVDGRREAPLETVKPDGVIVFEFELLTDLFVWIADQLEKHSPRKSGAYAASHTFFADGAEANPANPPPASDEWAFVSTVPYARKIERGRSRQAPDGVYEVVAALAQRRFGNQAKIDFTYRSLGGERQPAIVISQR
jgi:hypothetical protein